MVDVIEDIKVGYYTRNIGYNFIANGRKKNWMSVQIPVESSIYMMRRQMSNSKIVLKTSWTVCVCLGGREADGGKNLYT